MKFTKMQGIGNDYIYINGFKEKVEDPSGTAILLSDRHFGIGGDGIVLILPSEKADFRMRMFNADGSEAEMCGNAIRCVGKYVRDNGMTGKDMLSIETLAGIRDLQMTLENGLVTKVRVDMGQPVLDPRRIPVITEKMIFLNEPVFTEDRFLHVTCVSMGNPHAVSFVKDISSYEVEKYGRAMENHALFPKKTNCEFVEVVNRTTLRMRVWERGSGETLACGTGACAALVASVLNGLCDRTAVVRLLGGDLTIEWDEADGHVHMTGPAKKVFDGEI
ncbi:MAG: diaminopimelate epimerase [Clostridia bacterium]